MGAPWEPHMAKLCKWGENVNDQKEKKEKKNQLDPKFPTGRREMKIKQFLQEISKRNPETEIESSGMQMSLDRLQESLKRILDESRKRNHRRRNKMNMQMRLNTFPESLAIPWEKLPMEEGGEEEEGGGEEEERKNPPGFVKETKTSRKVCKWDKYTNELRSSWSDYFNNSCFKWQIQI